MPGQKANAYNNVLIFVLEMDGRSFVDFYLCPCRPTRRRKADDLWENSKETANGGVDSITLSDQTSPQKILFILDDFYPVSSAGAVRILSFIDELRDQQVEVLAGSRIQPPTNPFWFKVHFVKRPAETQPIRFALFLLKFLMKVIPICIRTRYDRIVVSVPKYELLILAPFLKRRTESVLLDLRDSHAFLNYRSYAAHFLPGFLATAFGNGMTVFSRRILRSALAAAALVSGANVSILESTAKEHANTRLIENGVDTDRFRPLEKAFTGTLNIVYVGNFAEKDRFDYLLNVLPKWQDDVLMHFIGEDRNKKNVLQRFRDAQIRYVDHGSVDHAALPGILQQMHAGCIFRDDTVVESIPVAIYEFCAMNIPTITNNVGLMGDTVRKHGLGVVISSSEELDSFLHKAMQDPATLKQFAGLHALAAANFSRKVQAKEFRTYLLTGN